MGQSDRFPREIRFKVQGETWVSKLVILSIGEGSFEQGFPVTVQIGEPGLHPNVAETGNLPALPQMPLYYSRWQSSYNNWGVRTRISVRKVTPLSLKEDCHNAAQILRARFNTWLRSDGFRPIEDTWRETLSPTDEIRVLLQTNNPDLQYLPWHLWEVLERYPKAEIGLSSPVFKSRSPHSLAKTKVNILAILGDSNGIDTTGDRTLLQQLPDAEVTFLVEPKRQELTDRLWEKPWDILFFAGHSDSQDGQGRIYINQTDSLTIAELKYALRKAVESGLKLAIFNSCQGLGLARDLADLQIPQTIFMREPVPDRVAQAFLKYFLTSFSQGESLYLSIRTARERLEALEDEFPYATWLPVIYQHPAEIPPTWHDLIGARSSQTGGKSENENRSNQRSRRSIVSTILISASMMASVVGVRHLGLLQAWELKAYDQMLQVRSLIQPEPPDNRILVVEITDQDVEAQKERKEALGDKSLSDTSLVRLLKILNKYQPRVIGLDLYRDAKGVPTDVVQVLQQMPNLIGICKSPSSKFDPNGIAPPQGITGDRIGFSDIPKDPDGVIRRQLLRIFQEPNSVCPPNYSFSLQLALRYLAAKGIQPKMTAENELQLGSTRLKGLSAPQAGYQQVSDLLVGDQILLNYRSQNVRPISLTDVLKDQQPLAIKDRIVLIGVTHQKTPDKHLTPYSQTDSSAVPGVFIQAQKVSQVLSAVLDNRPLIWVWSGWVEILWIGGWAVIGGFLVLQLHSLLYRTVGFMAISLSLWVVCLGIFTQGGWIPYIPPWIALTATGGIVVTYRFYLQQRHSTKL